MKTIRLETTALRSGRLVFDQQLKRVRIDNTSWRPARTADFNTAIRWLIANNFSYEGKHQEPAALFHGSVTVTYTYHAPPQESQ